MDFEITIEHGYLFIYALPFTPEGVTCLISALVFVVGLAYFMVASWGSALVLKTYLIPGFDNDHVAVVLDKSNRLA